MSYIHLFFLLIVLHFLFGGKKGKSRNSTAGSGQTGKVRSHRDR